MTAATSLALALALALSGCALLTKADPMTPRYFSPEAPSDPRASGAPPSAGAGAGLELRLARVNAGSSIRDKIIYRDSTYEVGFYEERRWTEKPEVYVRHALSRALFEQRGIAQVVAGAAPALDVDLVAFEEVRAPAHVARIELAYALRDDRAVSLAETVTVERPVPTAKEGAEANAVAQALGEALKEAVEHVAERVTLKLAAARGAPPSGSERPAATP